MVPVRATFPKEICEPRSRAERATGILPPAWGQFRSFKRALKVGVVAKARDLSGEMMAPMLSKKGV
eukprot:11890923-Alexandrium_andersonii.AAC.1